MPVCLPFERLQDKKNFLEIINQEGEVVVMQNGSNAFRCVSEKKLEITEEEAQVKLQERMMIAKKELDEEKFVPLKDVLGSLR